MIRNLVLALFALNLLYLGWSQWIDRKEPEWAVTSKPPSALPASVVAAAATAVTPPCATIGPFSDPLLALHAKERLQASGLTVQSREVSEALQTSTWLDVPGFSRETLGNDGRLAAAEIALDTLRVETCPAAAVVAPAGAAADIIPAP